MFRLVILLLLVIEGKQIEHEHESEERGFAYPHCQSTLFVE